MSGLTEDQALKGFEALSRSGFVHCAGEGRIAFNHEIVRRAVAKSMSGLRRITLHRRAFHLLAGEAEGAAAGSIVDQLAYHAREGELWNEAVSWYQESARMAEAVFAYSTACRRLDQALACLEKSGAGPNQLETELRLRAWRLRLGYWFDPGHDESSGDALEEEGQATVAGQIPEVLLARAETLYLQGNMSKAEPILRRVLELIGPSGNPELRGYAIGGIGAVQMFQGDLRQAIDASTNRPRLRRQRHGDCPEKVRGLHGRHATSSPESLPKPNRKSKSSLQRKQSARTYRRRHTSTPPKRWRAISKVVGIERSLPLGWVWRKRRAPPGTFTTNTTPAFGWERLLRNRGSGGGARGLGSVRQSRRRRAHVDHAGLGPCLSRLCLPSLRRSREGKRGRSRRFAVSGTVRL